MTGHPHDAGQPDRGQPDRGQPDRGQPDGRQPRPPTEPAAFAGAPASAPSFDDEIRAAVRYENGLAVKALLAIALVALVLALRVYFFG
jgi:hypothetical protein